LVLCRKKGIVTDQYCGTQCPDWVFATEDNLYGNSPRTCKDFGHIIRSPQELQSMGVEYVRKNDPRHEKLSKELSESEDRDTDKHAQNTWDIVTQRGYKKPIEGRDIRKKINARKIV